MGQDDVHSTLSMGSPNVFPSKIFSIFKAQSSVLHHGNSIIPFFSFASSTEFTLCMFSSRIFFAFAYKFFDGMIVISEPLKIFFSNKIKKDKNILIVPILFDMDEIDSEKCIPNVNLFEENIVYSGDLSERKDGFITLLKAFYLLCKKRPQSRLIVLGTSNNDLHLKNIKEFTRELEIDDKIIFLGFVSRNKYVNVLKSSKLL